MIPVEIIAFITVSESRLTKGSRSRLPLLQFRAIGGEQYLLPVRAEVRDGLFAA
jgi:hypothetical protein